MPTTMAFEEKSFDAVSPSSSPSSSYFLVPPWRVFDTGSDDAEGNALRMASTNSSPDEKFKGGTNLDSASFVVMEKLSRNASIFSSSRSLSSKMGGVSSKPTRTRP
ncbi:hypothetical protein Naga_100009g55 [Nannochloropsis gaditana]|uniref:Uncharacterized protein n=1 Tax=Nannochloropsis gaditana TaxID=72520 RepID=W7TR08_9STRA|nr:hypothetical protein Naga_100009g55 [Nannochloropsis gaditana]